MFQIGKIIKNRKLTFWTGKFAVYYIRNYLQNLSNLNLMK